MQYLLISTKWTRFSCQLVIFTLFVMLCFSCITQPFPKNSRKPLKIMDTVWSTKTSQILTLGDPTALSINVYTFKHKKYTSQTERTWKRALKKEILSSTTDPQNFHTWFLSKQNLLHSNSIYSRSVQHLVYLTQCGCSKPILPVNSCKASRSFVIYGTPSQI